MLDFFHSHGLKSPFILSKQTGFPHPGCPGCASENRRAWSRFYFKTPEPAIYLTLRFINRAVSEKVTRDVMTEANPGPIKPVNIVIR